MKNGGIYPNPCEMLRGALGAGGFMPLQLTVERDDIQGICISMRHEDDMTWAICYDPALLDLALQNGECLGMLERWISV